MSEYLSEQEQVDRIKTMVKKHGYSAFMGVMLALTGYFGFQYWQGQKQAAQVEASNMFQQVEQLKTGLTDTSAAGDKTKFFASVKKLVDASPDSVYALQALLLQAQQQVSDNKLAEAEKSLSQAAAVKLDDAGMVSIAQLRLAQVQLAQNKGKESLATLANVTLPAFSPSKYELEGDAHQQLKDIEKAKASYQKAWDELTKRQEPRPLLRLKMEEVGLKPAAIDVPRVLKDDAAI